MMMGVAAKSVVWEFGKDAAIGFGREVGKGIAPEVGPAIAQAIREHPGKVAFGVGVGAGATLVLWLIFG